MAALQDIKRRIRSVKSTRQITKAMQLVAASKLRRYADAANGPRAYVVAATDLLARLGTSDEATGHPLYEQRTVTRALTIVIAGDRTLAGPYNSNIYRALNKHLVSTPAAHDVIAVGRQMSVHAARRTDVTSIGSYNLELGNEDVELAQPILEQAIESFLDGTVDRVDVIFTDFYSSVRQEVKTVQLLPVVTPEAVAQAAEAVLEPSAEVVLDVATRRLLEAQLLAAIVGSRASEQAARMLAMMNASDNANDLIDDYTLSYNNARQAAITQELAEITAGAEAINA